MLTYDIVTTNRHIPPKQKRFSSAGSASGHLEHKGQGVAWGEAGLGEIGNDQTRMGLRRGQ